jgi:hypothetical protein
MPARPGWLESHIHPSRLDAALDVQSQLTAQEEVLGLDRLGRTEQQHHPAQGVFDQAQCNPEEGDHAFIVPQRSALSLPREYGRGGRRFCGGQYANVIYPAGRHERQASGKGIGGGKTRSRP